MSRKRVRLQSIEQYIELALSGRLATKDARVIRGLSDYRRDHGRWPTSSELIEFLKAKGLARDPNDVRPSLTQLRDEGIVETLEDRRVSTAKYSGRVRVYVWRLVGSRYDQHDANAFALTPA